MSRKGTAADKNEKDEGRGEERAFYSVTPP
jgi:hypothetical protein